MAENVIINLLPSKQLKSVMKATDSVTERSVLPPKPTKTITKASNLATERLVSSPVNLIKQLVFTEFGLSPVTTMRSPELSISPAEPNTVLHLPPSYCQCFAAGVYCDERKCKCINCRNNVENEALREAAVENILERSPSAFSPKIACTYSTLNIGDDKENVPMVGKHYKGCGCKKTGCLKKYCECYHAKVFCSENCKCVDCKNFEESVERMALSERDSFFEGSKETDTNGNLSNTNMCKNFQGSEEKIAFPGWENYKRKLCIQRANTAISTAIGLSGHSFLHASRKRKSHEFLDSNDKDPPNQRPINEQKANPRRISSALSGLSDDPVNHIVSSATPGSSEFHCRYTIHSRDVEKLCTLLVLVSEAAKILPDKNGNILEVQDMENCQEGFDVQKEVQVNHLSRNQVDAVNAKDSSFVGAARQNQIPNNGYKSDLYIKQEELVLKSFRNCLRKIITLGDLKAVKTQRMIIYQDQDFPENTRE
ncbi:protein tesmin/TSO1-like CXC 5 [Pistacia vera]|uniref:protein tesmin/TSO1-like CXC 5 n=1 Tax=Pistacia vera TaxID=55513 RepID=UPI0012631187|nr:protein tesmin/TSO1-like CXC 5 [Pistacia vera]